MIYINWRITDKIRDWADLLSIYDWTSVEQIDEDVQRHNELLEVVRRDPSGITEIVSKRRKDFTEEFFVHLHAVAESYYDNKEEQDGRISFRKLSVV